MTGFKVSGGADLNTVFHAYTGSNGQATATGFKVSGGADLNTVFEPLSAGSAAGVTGFKISGGADLNTVFAAINTVTLLPNIIIDTSASAAGSIDVGGTGTSSAFATLYLNRDGNVSSARSGVGANDPVTYNIDWLDEIGTTNGDDFEARYTITSGTASSGTLTTTYQRMNTNRVVTVTSTSGTKTLSGTLQIRKYLSSDTPVTRAFSITCNALGGVGPVE